MIKLKNIVILSVCLFCLAILTSACGSSKSEAPDNSSLYYYILAQQQNNNEQNNQNNQNNQEEQNNVSVLKVSKSLVSILVGGEDSVTVTLNDEDVTSQVTFTVDDETVARVENGVVTGVGAGITTVEVSLENAESVTFVVYVTEEGGEVFALKVSDDKVSVAVGGESKITVTLEDVDVTDSVTYKVDDESIAKVDKGTITGVSAGTATVTVSLEGANSAVFSVDVISNPFVGAEIGDVVKMGSYFYTSDGEFQPIEWQVLYKKDNSLLVVSKYVLDGHHIDTYVDGYSYSWANSDMCKFLNGYFYNTAFNDAEKSFIYSTPLEDVDNTGGTYNVFLLSGDWNGNGEINQYFSSNEERRCEATPYALERCYSWNGYAYYWLRTAYSSDFVFYVSSGGSIIDYDVGDTTPGVRPALWINL